MFPSSGEGEGETSTLLDPLERAGPVAETSYF
jgi:hypothetical protein